MRKAYVFLPYTSHSWSNDDIRRLREFADAGLAAKEISLALKRSESAIRNKASMHGISLRAPARRISRSAS